MNLIEKLAKLVGFHATYTNSFGEKVFAKDEARHSLLNAMGYDLSCDKKIAASITELEQKTWRNMLPPAHIAKFEAEQHHVTISIANSAMPELNWEITLESGAKIKDRITLTALTLLDSATFNDSVFTKYALPLPALAQGYHQLTLQYGELSATCPLIFAPQTCYSPQEASSDKMWGYAAQLYSLTSTDNLGMGDFGDLAKLIDISAKQQASAIGLNPLHPLYQNNPAHRSPYSPTSRCFLNTLYIDIKQVPNFANCQVAQSRFHSEEIQHKISLARQTKLIDYPAVADIKFEILELLFQDFISTITDECAELKEFNAFKHSQGEDLLQLATFEALYEHFRKTDPNAYGWPNWPTEFQAPDSYEVKAFQQEYSSRINYFCFLQWLAHRQLKSVAKQAKDAGMPVGLYLDLAVGCDGSGVDVWSDKDVYVAGAAVGAPPDAMNTLGQDWGLTPINPVALQKQGYQPLVKALRSNMQYAGALRIDHILGLMRQYWVAPGMKADQGVYITFPLEDILRIIALESRRNNCVVIGEDLGTVPDGFGEIMARAGLLSYKVLFFERWDSGFFMRPELYPAQSMVTVSTHDLPTLAGWWTGKDLEWRQKLQLYPNEVMGQNERNSRIEDRKLLLDALNDHNVIDMSKAPAQAPATMNRELSLGVQKYMAKAPSHIQLIPLEDALDVIEQVNIPGTIDEHPNWLQKLPVTIEEFDQIDSVTELATAMKIARPRTNRH
ncbi:4-alpha-glucanotransferase [Colwellia sp. BRX10-3]|uniref:4-alpha-glucanotransferase n=1 Tax=Colwellia sp. BRX10-3 TaxID=2759844 RepID=UPI0015F49FDF|nr:4-alpha-glucanotransferase [Colwellia sp. BRX10-3]MBA6391885.1 4-alpha-glucanotransferase [Colwellia sp. BRX10-3]